MEWLLLWPLLGLLSWGWISHNAHRYDGAKADRDPLKWWLFWFSPVLGPFLGILNIVIASLCGRLYWGLRFR